MDLLCTLVQDAHTLTDSEIEALLKFFVRECDRRFLDYQEVIEEVEQEMEIEYDMEKEMEQEPDYIGVEKQGW